ncbi:MAG: DUF6691 family protein [Alphaproteobacteria bacterium]
MAVILAAFATGLLFGAGLAVSHMMDPMYVLGFLDIAGDWNPTLLFVMGGAVTAAAPGFYLMRVRRQPLLGGAFQVPTRRDIDTRLLAGSLLFGIGWGIAGLCPGPALAGLSTGMWQFLVFVPAMLAGMALHDGAGHIFDRRAPTRSGGA